MPSLLDRIAQEAKVSEDYLRYIVLSADHQYRTYPIPKKKGAGSRVIEHPSRPLKYLQRWVARNIFAAFPVHRSAMAYKRHVGIRDNAAVHSRSKYVLHMDFADFFHSITADDIRYFLTSKPDLPYNESDLGVLTRIVCRRGRLTMGAPSSPIISNVLLFDLDSLISAEATKRGMKYSRYADDLFFSGGSYGAVRGMSEVVQQLIAGMRFPCLTINTRKTALLSKKRKVVVTGLVLTSDGRVSLGRGKKREIKALVHQWCCGRLKGQDVIRLKGTLAFTKGVEPTFIESLKAKYGGAIQDLLYGHGESYSKGVVEG